MFPSGTPLLIRRLIASTAEFPEFRCSFQCHQELNMCCLIDKIEKENSGIKVFPVMKKISYLCRE